MQYNYNEKPRCRISGGWTPGVPWPWAGWVRKRPAGGDRDTLQPPSLSGRRSRESTSRRSNLQEGQAGWWCRGERSGCWVNPGGYRWLQRSETRRFCPQMRTGWLSSKDGRPDSRSVWRKLSQQTVCLTTQPSVYPSVRPLIHSFTLCSLGLEVSVFLLNFWYFQFDVPNSTFVLMWLEIKGAHYLSSIFS